MKEEQRLFLVQSRSAYAIYWLLRADTSVHHCHPLHYLQMATELLAKASAWKNSKPKKSHKALVAFLRNLSSNSKAQTQLGFEGYNDNWKQQIRKLVRIAEELERLAPNLSDGPNPEYPWPAEAPTNAPVEYDFPIWKELTETAPGRKLSKFLDRLFEKAEGYL